MSDEKYETKKRGCAEQEETVFIAKGQKTHSISISLNVSGVVGVIKRVLKKEEEFNFEEKLLQLINFKLNFKNS